ncbi:hypothetical protein B0H13DRAFT_1923060 [Mycena leptocephala]|nr:hypothetical protein B0H13DRAFT_1923060 [Mycena leptocephala]
MADQSDIKLTTPKNYPPPGSRHHNLLYSNEIPLDSDLAIVKATVSRTEALLEPLNREISRLQARLGRLEKECTMLPQYRVQNTSILSPLMWVPPEVLAEIFSWTVPAVPNTFNRSKVDVAASPWVLTYVSSLWRAVAVSNALLWSRSVIDWIEPYQPSAFPSSLIKTQIERAQNCTSISTLARQPSPTLKLKCSNF